MMSGRVYLEQKKYKKTVMNEVYARIPNTTVRVPYTMLTSVIGSQTIHKLIVLAKNASKNRAIF
jgi:hypothetical protein